jgi:hypothetical protein
VAAWLSWYAANRLPARVLPAIAGRRREHLDATSAVPRPAIDRALTRRDVPLLEKTLWARIASRALRGRVPAGWCWIASTSAQRSSRPPCLDTCPRITLVRGLAVDQHDFVLGVHANR